MGAAAGAVRAAAIGAEAGGGEVELATEVEVLGPRGPWEGVPWDVFGAERAEAEVAGAERVVAAFHRGVCITACSRRCTVTLRWQLAQRSRRPWSVGLARSSRR